MRITPLFALALVAACTPAVPTNSPIVAAARADSISWQAATPLSVGRDHHVTFITSRGGKSHLWVAGGNDYRRTMADVWRAQISADGSLGGWAAGPALPGQHAGMGVATTDRFVILTGGKDSAQRTTTDVFTSRIDSDGNLGAWSRSGTLPGPRFHHATIIDGRYLYVVGGLQAAVSVPAVLRATLSRDGVIEKWDSLGALPRPRSHQSIFIHDRAMYLVGGLDGNPAGANTPLADVIRAPVLSDGTLGNWEQVSTMEHAYATHATAVHGNTVWLFGGVEDNARFVDIVLRSTIGPDGKLGEWTRVTPALPAARSHVHQVPILGNRVYSTAGSNRRVVTGDVHVGTLLSMSQRTQR